MAWFSGSNSDPFHGRIHSTKPTSVMVGGPTDYFPDRTNEYANYDLDECGILFFSGLTESPKHPMGVFNKFTTIRPTGQPPFTFPLSREDGNEVRDVLDRVRVAGCGLGA